MSFMEIREMMTKRKQAIVDDAIAFSSIPGINPQMGGTGEFQRIEWLKKKLDDKSIPYEVFTADDPSAPEGKRYGLIVKMSGAEDREKTLWFVSHVDTVSAGDLNAWNTDPYTPTIKDGRIYGLGVEDNGQAVISTLHTCFIMAEKALKAKCNIGFIFASDEETGSHFGLQAMVKAGIFSSKDEAIVPDFGSSDGSFIEVAEKSVLWLKFTTTGKQAHASMPHLGVNAGSVGSRFAIALEDMLKATYNHNDMLFDPPYSSFEPTQKFNNVESTNVIPGKDVFTMDCRVLPTYSLDELLAGIETLRKEFEKKYLVQINREVMVRADAAPPTSPDSKIAKTLLSILKDIGVNAKCGGIGGGTCGAILRECNVSSLVWSTLDELAHQPNEYAVIDNMLQDASVFLAVIEAYS